MPTPTTFVSLGDLLAEGFSKSSIRTAFSRFTCERDADVAFFLKAHAIQNEGTGASRTFLALSSEALGKNELEVVAFVTLAIAVTDYTSIGTDRRLQVMGRVPGVETANFFPGYLVAQLARDDRYAHDDFDAAKLLPLAEGLMREAAGVVGGRLAYLDCKPELLDYYKAQDYDSLFYDEEKGLHKLIKPLY